MSHMAVLTRPVDERPAPRRRRGLLTIVAVSAIALAAALVVSVWRDDPKSSLARGSGHPSTEVRHTAPFTRLELAGANTLNVRIGAPQSVAVTADDNLVDRVTTTVRRGTLVVAERGSFTTKTPTRVTVSAPSLDEVTLSGAGTVTVERVAADQFTATLSGSGTLKVSGTADRVTAVLTDSGTVELSDLVVRDAVARLDGTGTIRVHATSTLDATLTGTGSILYSGHPTVTEHRTGTGSITPQ